MVFRKHNRCHGRVFSKSGENNRTKTRERVTPTPDRVKILRAKNSMSLADNHVSLIGNR